MPTILDLLQLTLLWSIFRLAINAMIALTSQHWSRWCLADLPSGRL